MGILIRPENRNIAGTVSWRALVLLLGFILLQSCEPQDQEKEPPQPAAPIENAVVNKGSWTEQMYGRSGKDLIPYHLEEYNTPDGRVTYLHKIDLRGDAIRTLIFRFPKSEDDGTYEVKLTVRPLDEASAKIFTHEEIASELDQIIAALTKAGFKEQFDRFHQGERLREFPTLEDPFDNSPPSNPEEYEQNVIANINETNLLGIVNLIKHYRETFELP